MRFSLTRRTALSGAALLAAGAAVGAVNVQSLASRLRAHCEELARAGDLSGAVLLVENGRPLFRAAFGLADRERNLANTPETHFNLASVGKMFTSLSIMRFVESGRIALDDKLGKHWPDYPNPAVAQSVTLAQLLTHMAGIGNHYRVTAAKLPPTATQTQIVHTFAAKAPDAVPGAAFSYSNDGFIILGALIERLSGMPYADHCHATIFAPLGMNGTGFVVPRGRPAGFARAYARDLKRPGVWRDATETDGLAPVAAGGCYSTVDDMQRFADAIGRGRLLKPELTRAWLQGRIAFRSGRYGYGTMEESLGAQRIVGHNGGHYGIAAELMMFEGRGLTCVILMNGEVETFYDLSNWMKREAAGEHDGLRDYYFTRALIDAFARDAAEARALYARRDPARKAREFLIDTYGMKFVHQGNAKAGLALLRFNVEIFPESSSALWSLAEALRIAGQRADALSAYRTYLVKEPGDADAERHIGELSAR